MKHMVFSSIANLNFADRTVELGVNPQDTHDKFWIEINEVPS